MCWRKSPASRSSRSSGQVSAKNNFAFGFSMEFAHDAAYQGYSDHPGHVRFVRERWVTEVEEFLEIDYRPL